MTWYIHCSYLATATYIPDQSKFYFYGGVENYPAYSWYLDSVTGVNITNPIFTSDTTRSKIGYYRMTTLDINSTATNVSLCGTSRIIHLLTFHIALAGTRTTESLDGGLLYAIFCISHHEQKDLLFWRLL